MTPSPNQPLDALASELEKAAKKSVDVFFENRSENTVAVFSARNILSLLAERKRDKAVIDLMEKELRAAKQYLDSLGELPIEDPEHQMRYGIHSCLASVAKIKGES